MRLCTCHYHQLVRELPAVMKHNRQRGTTVPLTEAETEMIHSQFGLGNQQFIHLARASQSLLFPTKHSCFCTWHHVETRKNSRQKTESTEHTANETAVPSVEKNNISITCLERVVYFARYSTRSPLAVAGSSAISQTPGERLLCVAILGFTPVPA